MFSLYNNFDQSFRDNIGCSAINIARWALSVPGTGIISLVKVITQIFSAHSGSLGIWTQTMKDIFRMLVSERLTGSRAVMLPRSVVVYIGVIDPSKLR